MKTKKHLLSFVIITIIFLLLNWLKRDIIFFTNTKWPIISAAILGLLIFIIYALYILFGVVSIVLHIKRVKSISYMMIIVYVFAIITVFVFPRTELYTNIDYNINRTNRELSINMIKSGGIDEYRIDIDEYITPFRQASYNRIMHIQEENGVLKVMFYVYLGMREKSVIVYVSDDSGIEADDFSIGLPPEATYGFNDVKKLSSNWYSANIG